MKYGDLRQVQFPTMWKMELIEMGIDCILLVFAGNTILGGDSHFSFSGRNHSLDRADATKSNVFGGTMEITRHTLGGDCTLPYGNTMEMQITSEGEITEHSGVFSFNVICSIKSKVPGEYHKMPAKLTMIG